MAQAVAVQEGRIVYVGNYAGALALSDDGTERHDLKRQMLLPGFIS